DNVILTETTDNTYLIRNSATICTGAENCAAYTDINSQTFYLKSFTKLCDEEVAGCEEMIDTRNTSNPYNEAFGTEIPSGIPTGSDYGSNYVNNPEIYCDASDRGCRALGKPVIAPDDSDPDELDSIADYETIYLKDDAERYSAIWCDASEVGCEQYNFSGGLGTAYFQDPGAKTCEYKQQAGSLVYDWYKTGTEEECPTTAVPDPAPFIPTNDWAGLCTSQYDGCTAYRDPMDPVECNPEYPYEVDETNSPIMRGTSPGCETYYYISSSVDQNSCNGTVDEQKGCKLFNNTDDPTDVFTADLSPDGQEKYCDNSDPDYYGDLCTTDSDCGTGTCLENAQTGPPAVCSEGICIGGTNPGDACTAAGGECQGGACSLFTPIDSGYCDSNSVIKVERDRECEEWLYCKTSLEVDDPDDNDGDGQTKEQVCYEIGACNGIGPGGQCNSFVGESPVNVIGDTAGFDFDEFQNYSGFVSAGLMYGCNQSICLGGTNDYTSCSTDAECTGNGVCTAGASISCTVATEDSDCGAGNHCEIIEGLYPYSEMYEVGMGGATSVNDLINFGDFESDPNGNFLVCDSSNDKSKNPCIADSECVSGDPPVNGQCNNGSLLPAWAAIDNGTVQVVENDSTIMGNEALDENNFLKFEPDQASTSTGVKGEMDSGSILNDQEYSLTLEAGFLGEFGSSADIIQATFAQIDGNGQVLWEEPIGEIPATLGFQQYILDPYTVQNIPNENEKSYLLLKPQGPYCVGGSNAGTACPIGNECQGGGSCQIQLVKIPFKVDNVSLKPVLAVQSANTNGLRGDYYDLVWQDVGDPGLNEECFADGNLTDPSTCPGNPYLAPRINWYAACVYCNPPGAQQYCDHCGNGDTVVSSDEMDPYVPIQSTQDIFESASSARWTGGIYFDQSDDYVLFFNIDDGFRVWIDDMSTPVFSKWSTVPVQGYYVEKDFEAGWHPIKVEWNNTIGSGGPQMGWFKEPDTGWSGGATNFSPAADCDGSPLGDWCEDYCISTTSCSGDFHTQIPNDKLIPQTKLTTSISKEFGNYHSTLYSNYLDFGDFLPTLQTQANTQEMAAVRWNGQVLADTTGDYTFWFDVNDGLKFYLDDLNTDVFGGAQWIDGDREVSHTATGLSAGWHNIKIEYYQNESAATMRFGWDPPSGGKVYPIPANHLANAGIPDYKARSCRAYPRDDSLACNYVDDDLVSFNGWQGYCIETDPTNPDRCVTWWPVDIISGESSVFGTIDPAGYQGKTPLYYCAESTSRFVGDQGLSGSGTSWPYGARYSGICNCIGFPPTCTAPPNDGYIPETPYCTVYDITNEYTPDGDNANVFLESSYWWYWDPDDSDCDDLEAEGYDLVTAYNQSPSIAKPWGLYGGCAAHTILDGIFPFSPSLASFYEDEVEKVVIEVIDRSHAGDWPNAGTQWELDRSNGWHMGWNEGSCSNSNCLVVTANLDANGKFSTWDWTLMDGSEYDGGMFLKVMIYLRQSCIDVVKVVDYTENKAWASRTSEGSSYVVPDLGYRYEGSSHPDDLPYPEPFGAVVAAPSDPDVDRSGWDSRGSPEGGYQPPYIEDKDDTPAGGPPSPNYQVRAGLPYACGPNYGINSNECGSKFCVGGKDASGNSLDGHSCANDTDCGSDSSDRGFCQGVGTCSDTLRTCRVDADCPNISGNEICIGAAAGSKDLNWSVDRLKRLFAKPYGLWGWNWNQGIFESDFSAVSQWVTAYNSMPACWGTGVGPRPAFNASTDADYCGIYPTVYNIKVNGAENNVTFASGGVANLTFNSMVDPDQQPLVDFTIDWGDDTNPPSINWGGAPKTDPAEPHLVSHTYTCVAGDIGWNPAMNRCEFPIEIMARDNWEFCNVNGRNCAIDTYNYDFFGGATGRVYVTP
ncbi:MAG: hypothetical protein COY66_06260, partial [Candidatus Kerfeldbacteria bacterium CG_4_10_14_0_8_um_filter_42_10]